MGDPRVSYDVLSKNSKKALTFVTSFALWSAISSTKIYNFKTSIYGC